MNIVFYLFAHQYLIKTNRLQALQVCNEYLPEKEFNIVESKFIKATFLKL